MTGAAHSSLLVQGSPRVTAFGRSIDAMSDEPIASHSFCVVEGCTSPSMLSRRVTLWGEDHQVDVCLTHEEAEINEDDVDRSKLGS